MALATARARTPDKQKGRTVAVRPFQNFSSNSVSEDIAARLRRQHLERLGVSELRADLIASLAWGAIR